MAIEWTKTTFLTPGETRQILSTAVPEFKSLSEAEKKYWTEQSRYSVGAVCELIRDLRGSLRLEATR